MGASQSVGRRAETRRVRAAQTAQTHIERPAGVALIGVVLCVTGGNLGHFLVVDTWGGDELSSHVGWLIVQLESGVSSAARIGGNFFVWGAYRHDTPKIGQPVSYTSICA